MEEDDDDDGDDVDHIGVCTCVRTCVCFVTKCHVTCHNYQVFHVRTYFLYFRTKSEEACHNYQVFHVRMYFLYFRTKSEEACHNYQVFHVHIFYLPISEVYQHLCELVEWHHFHSLQPLKSASESKNSVAAKRTVHSVECPVMPSCYSVYWTNITECYMSFLLGWDIVPYLKKGCPCPPREGVEG